MQSKSQQTDLNKQETQNEWLKLRHWSCPDMFCVVYVLKGWMCCSCAPTIFMHSACCVFMCAVLLCDVILVSQINRPLGAIKEVITRYGMFCLKVQCVRFRGIYCQNMARMKYYRGSQTFPCQGPLNSISSWVGSSFARCLWKPKVDCFLASVDWQPQVPPLYPQVWLAICPVEGGTLVWTNSLMISS